MLLATPLSARWRRISWWLVVLLTAAYGWAAYPDAAHGGSRIGIAYGIIGSALIVLLLAFGIRKRRYRSRLGRVESWLQSHVYLGLLVVVVILLHSGFRFHDLVAVTAFALLGLVAASGVVGAVAYTLVPAWLTEAESNLTPQQISDQLNQLAQSMGRLASGKSAAFRATCARLLRAERPGWLAGWRVVWSRGASAPMSERGGAWQALRDQVGLEERGEFDALLVLSRQRQDLHRRLIARQRYQNLLEAWLYLHVPLSVAMLVAIAAHVTAFFYYVAP